jgi:hypothetical protein
MFTTLLLAASLSAGPIAADGHVDAPEGFRARLPAGFRYASDVQNGFTNYRAADPAGAGLVSVALIEGAAALCQETGVAEVQPGSRLKMTALRTRGGLEGCVIQSRNAQGALTLAIAYGPDASAVVVAAIAKDVDRADRLARSAAESVSFAPAQPADPRIVGCFRRESSSSVPGIGAGAPAFIGVKWRTRCFLPDHRYVQRSGMAISRAREEDVDAEGIWRARPGRLAVQAGDGSWAGSIQFDGDDDLLLDGTLWRRTSDAVTDEEEAP